MSHIAPYSFRPSRLPWPDDCPSAAPTSGRAAATGRRRAQSGLAELTKLIADRRGEERRILRDTARHPPRRDPGPRRSERRRHPTCFAASISWSARPRERSSMRARSCRTRAGERLRRICAGRRGFQRGQPASDPQRLRQCRSAHAPRRPAALGGRSIAFPSCSSSSAWRSRGTPARRAVGPLRQDLNSRLSTRLAANGRNCRATPRRSRATIAGGQASRIACSRPAGAGGWRSGRRAPAAPPCCRCIGTSSGHAGRPRRRSRGWSHWRSPCGR